MQKLLLCLLFCASAFSISAQITETKISNGLLGFDGEPVMSVNPANHQHLVMAWMSLGLKGASTQVTIKTRVSRDGGLTWTNPVSMPHFSPSYGSADPAIAFLSNAIVYIAYVDYKQSIDSGGLYLFKSGNGGETWSFQSKILDAHISSKRPLDRPWMEVDRSSGPHHGYIYVTSKPAPWIPAPNRPYLSVSADGTNWAPLRFVDTSNYLTGNFIQAPMAAPSMAADGTFLAVYPSYVATQLVYPQMILAKSTSGGSTFSYQTVVNNPANAMDTNLKSGYQLLAHPSNAKHMIFTGIEGKNGDADVWLYRSNNGGSSWSNAVRVNDDSVGNGKLQDLVWASWGRAGELAVCWRDRRNNSGKGFAQGSDCYCAVSTDTGKTFGKNIRMSANTAAFHNILYQNGNDFMSCALNGDTLIAIWGDIRSNKLEIWESMVNWQTMLSGSPRLLVSEQLRTITVYPNPASDLVTLDIPEGMQSATFCIADLSGKIIRSFIPGPSSQISVSGLASGTYVVYTNVSGQYSSQILEVVK